MCRDEIFISTITLLSRARAKMVSAVSSINQYPVDRESLEIIRRLQSLGVTPTGNISIDKQRLQTAELQKKQETLAANSEQNLSSIQGTDKDFSSTLNNIGGAQTQKTDNAQEVQPIAPADNSGTVYNSLKIQASNSSQNTSNSPEYQMLGATQLAELNKLKLGLIA